MAFDPKTKHIYLPLIQFSIAPPTGGVGVVDEKRIEPTPYLPAAMRRRKAWVAVDVVVFVIVEGVTLGSGLTKTPVVAVLSSRHRAIRPPVR